MLKTYLLRCQDPEKKREEMEFAMPRCEPDGTGGQQLDGEGVESGEQGDDEQPDGDDEQTDGDDEQTDGIETVEQTENVNDNGDGNENEAQNDDEKPTDGGKKGADKVRKN